MEDAPREDKRIDDVAMAEAAHMKKDAKKEEPFWNKKMIRRAFQDMAINIVAGLCAGVGIYNLARANQFPLAGISGILLIFNYLFHTPIGMLSLLLNIPLAIFTRRFLSKKFILKTLATLATTSIIIDTICPMIPVYTEDRMLAAILAGVLLGIYGALLYTNNTSGGGTDFITMSIRSRHPYFSISTLNFAMAAVIILGSGIVYKDFTSVIYGIMVIFIQYTVVDRILRSIGAGKLMLIISGKSQEIYEVIHHDIDRTATLITGTGMYSGNDSHVMMLACTDRQSFEIREKIRDIDEHAFTIVLDSREVIGRGFQKQ